MIYLQIFITIDDGFICNIYLYITVDIRVSKMPGGEEEEVDAVVMKEREMLRIG